MEIRVSKEELQSIRDIIRVSRDYMRSVPNPSVFGNDIKIARKLIRKLNAALKKVYGHDCMGDLYL